MPLYNKVHTFKYFRMTSQFRLRSPVPKFSDNFYSRHHHHHTFNGPFSETTRVSQYQKGKTNLDFAEARDSEWQWHQLGHMQVCTLLQTDNHASTPPLSFFTGRIPFLLPNQQRQSTEGTISIADIRHKTCYIRP